MLHDRNRRPRTAAFRGALWITFIAVVTTVVALTTQHLQTSKVISAELEHLLGGETDALVSDYKTFGLDRLKRDIALAAAEPTKREVVYMLADASGRSIAGNVAAWPDNFGPGGLQRITVLVGYRHPLKARVVEAEARTLSPDLRLLVGHYADNRMMLSARYWLSLGLSVLLTAVLGLTLGMLVSRRSISAVEQAARAGDRFLSGHFEERLAVSNRDDEFDRLAEVVNACFDEIERMVTSLRAATDGLAHDLKTPLTRIKARLELAALREAPSTQLDLLSETARDLDSMLQLINGLLALARADATTADGFVDLDLAAIAQEAVDLYSPLAEDRRQIIVARLEPALSSGVPALLLHAVANLIDNAVKHAPEQGLITVATGQRGDWAFLSISDNGPGIPPGLRDEAVERFRRLDQSRSTPGSGLGLSLVATVARVHKGRLKLEDNRPGLKAELQLPTLLMEMAPAGSMPRRLTLQ
ncbi:MAG: hypothetical protein B7Y99_00200 [Caulobacterales bacterium 32-69-10]|nr:MAG: hypothetical protein B7Y99_00200 [Caulobacterales bacterium 32-69-10]